MNKNQRGFSVVEALIILIIVTLLGGIGFYVWNSKKSSSNTSSSSSSVAKVASYEECVASSLNTVNKDAFPQTCTTKDGTIFTNSSPATDWKEYVSKEGKYTLKHPASWRADTCPNLLGKDFITWFGPTKASSVICNTEHISQIWAISSSAVPTQSEQNLSSDYGEKTEEKVVVDGVTGKRQYGKLKKAIEGPTTLPAGTIQVNYIFLTPGRSYVFVYLQMPGSDYKGDYLDEFDYMVQKTVNIIN